MPIIEEEESYAPHEQDSHQQPTWLEKIDFHTLESGAPRERYAEILVLKIMVKHEMDDFQAFGTPHGPLGTPPVVNALLKSLSQDSDPKIRAQVAKALGESACLILRCFRRWDTASPDQIKPPPNIHKIVEKSLVYIGKKSRLYDSVQPSVILETVERGLVFAQPLFDVTKTIEQDLVPALQDESPRVRKAAAKALRKIGTPSALEAVPFKPWWKFWFQGQPRKDVFKEDRLKDDQGAWKYSLNADKDDERSWQLLKDYSDYVKAISDHPDWAEAYLRAAYPNTNSEDHQNARPAFLMQALGKVNKESAIHAQLSCYYVFTRKFELAFCHGVQALLMARKKGIIGAHISMVQVLILVGNVFQRHNFLAESSNLLKLNPYKYELGPREDRDVKVAISYLSESRHKDLVTGAISALHKVGLGVPGVNGHKTSLRGEDSSKLQASNASSYKDDEDTRSLNILEGLDLIKAIERYLDFDISYIRAAYQQANSSEDYQNVKVHLLFEGLSSGY